MKRKFVFVGDSTMFHQYNSFCELFGGTIDAYEQYRRVSICALADLGASAHFYGFGIRSAWKWTQKADHLLRIAKAVEALGAGDVLLASSGIHFTRVCRKIDWGDAEGSDAGPPPLQFADDKYEYYVQSLLSIVNPAGRGRCKQLQPLPILLWRDVLPQHFPSSNGLYDPSLHPNMTSPCFPMTKEVYTGQSRAHYSLDFGNGAQSAARLGQCEPNCLPANWQNKVVKPFLEEQCVWSLRVFDELACLHEHHVQKEGDCTHYSMEVHALLNDRFLAQVSKMP